jgi:hypothetical protein
MLRLVIAFTAHMKGDVGFFISGMGAGAEST